MSDSPEQLLPLDSWHRARGARMVPFAGYQMPVQYEGIIAEHRWTRESAGLFDVSHMGQLIVAGAEAEKGLESLLPADLAILRDGRLRYSLLLNEEGGIIDDLMATRRGEHFYLVVNGATKQGDIAHLVMKHMKQVGAHQLALRPQPADRKGPQPAVSDCGHLDSTRIFEQVIPSGKAKNLNVTAAPFQAIEQGGQEPAAIVPVEAASQEQYLEYATRHGYPSRAGANAALREFPSYLNRRPSGTWLAHPSSRWKRCDDRL